MSPTERTFPDFVGPFRVERSFGSDSYYFEVQDSKGQRVTDYDSEGPANWMRDYLNKGGDKGESRYQKWCSDCRGSGHVYDVRCATCNGAGLLP